MITNLNQQEQMSLLESDLDETMQIEEFGTAMEEDTTSSTEEQAGRGRKVRFEDEPSSGTESDT